MRFLITGSKGFIAKHLRNKLETEGHEVLGIDISGGVALDLWLSTAPVYGVDVNCALNSSMLGAFFRSAEPDVVIHAAAQSHLPACQIEPRDACITNVMGTVAVLEGVRSLQKYIPNHTVITLMIGSGEEYGFGTPDDSTGVLQPENMYGATKAAASMLVQGYIRSYKMDVRIVRLATVYGMWQSRDKFIPMVTYKLLTGENVELHNRGLALRDWVHVDDVCASLIHIATQGRYCGIYHVTGEAASIGTVANIIARQLTRMNDPYTVKRKFGELILVEGGSLSRTVVMRRSSSLPSCKVMLDIGVANIVRSICENQSTSQYATGNRA